MKKTKIFENKVRLLQIVGAVLVCGALLGVFLYCYIVYGAQLTEIISDKEKLDALLAQFNNYDKLVFVAIRAFQTVIKIIPAEPLEIGSGYLYGTWGGLLYCMLGTFTGSLVIIALSKVFGKRLVNLFFPVEKINSLKFLQNKKRVYQSLFFIYLIPGTPKDILTYAASITDLNMVKFMIVTSIARIPSIITSTIVGAELMEQNYFFAAAIFIGTAIISIICSAIYNKYSSAKDKKSSAAEAKDGEDA
ncbi:MAG: TVP38/TMEM64 family protein [Clostridia bacterium]|nr:TVP38/TMEM64 family protein [Clostridia bacterium]